MELLTLKIVLYNLAQAVLDNNWAEMQRVQKQLQLVDGLNTSAGNRRRVIDMIAEVLEVRPEDLGVPHCKNCGQLELAHANGTKCLYDSSKFEVCQHKIPEAALVAMKKGEWVNALREYRYVMGAGLKEAKDVIDAEMNIHKWPRKTV